MLTLGGKVTKLWSNYQKIGHLRRPFQSTGRRSPIAMMIEESRPCRPEKNLSVDRESISHGHKGHVLGGLLGRAHELIGHEKHHTLGRNGRAQHRHCSMGCKITQRTPVTWPQEKIGQVLDLGPRQKPQNTHGHPLLRNCTMVCLPLASTDASTEVVQEQDRLWPVVVGKNLTMIKSFPAFHLFGCPTWYIRCLGLQWPLVAGAAPTMW